jgi:hypothetical protein
MKAAIEEAAGRNTEEHDPSAASAPFVYLTYSISSIHYSAMLEDVESGWGQHRSQWLQPRS